MSLRTKMSVKKESIGEVRQVILRKLENIIDFRF